MFQTSSVIEVIINKNILICKWTYLIKTWVILHYIYFTKLTETKYFAIFDTQKCPSHDTDFVMEWFSHNRAEIELFTICKQNVQSKQQ